MRNQSKILFCCKLTVLYVLAKLKFLHVLLPKELKNELPIDWNNRMFWTAFQSGGQKIYFDYYSELKKPVSYEPKIKVDSELQLTEKDLISRPTEYCPNNNRIWGLSRNTLLSH
jgi:hypothetical protein